MSVNGPLAAPSRGGFELGAPTHSAGAASSPARSGLFGLAGLLATGFVISISAAGTNNLLPQSVRPVPIQLAGPFGITGINLGFGGLTAVLAVMFVSYAAAVRTAEQLSSRLVLACIAALIALMLLAPPLISTDVFSYQFYGRMGALYGANPYLAGPHALALDPLYPYIGAKWVYTPSVYGPVFTAISYLLAPLSIATNVVAYKGIAALSSLALVAIVWNAARLRGVDPVKAAALVGLNPLIIVFGVGGGHNDLLMLAPLIAGAALVLQRRDRAGGAAIAFATGIKLTAGLLLPFALAGARGPLSTRRRRHVLAGALVATALVAALSFGLFGTGPLHLPATLEQVQSLANWQSIPGFIGTIVGTGTVSRLVAFLLGVVFAGTCAWLLRRVWRGELDWIAGAGWATLALLLSAASLLPWYVSWLMPLAALGRDRRLWRASIVVTGIVCAIQVAGYVPHGSALISL